MNVVLHDRDPKSKPVLVAVDLGAESCRVSLLRWIDGAAGRDFQLCSAV